MHTRGRHAACVSSLGFNGTTHAHAGQTNLLMHPVRADRNHPCARGADVQVYGIFCCCLEPPMRTRGRLGAGQLEDLLGGTTHAHAGQTIKIRIVWVLTWNHPCTRGADLRRPGSNLEPGEPPMHTRGRRWASCYGEPVQGTTHAHAGQTLAD